MESGFCNKCNIEKNLEGFHKNYTECKDGNSKRSVKRYYENKDKTSNQEKLYYGKHREKPLQKQNER